MGKHDWYRNTTWSSGDQEAFFSRLKRSRSDYNKAQYLRIQALYLQETGKPELITAALALIDKLTTECPDPSQLASAYCIKARCHIAFEQLDAALDAYRAAIQAEKDYPHAVTGATFEYCWLVLRNRIADRYNELKSILDNYGTLPPLPVYHFMFNTATALLNDNLGNLEIAQGAAKKALQAVGATESGVKYHQDFGLVGKQDERLMKKLWELASANKAIEPDRE